MKKEISTTRKVVGYGMIVAGLGLMAKAVVIAVKEHKAIKGQQAAVVNMRNQINEIDKELKEKFETEEIFK